MTHETLLLITAPLGAGLCVALLRFIQWQSKRVAQVERERRRDIARLAEHNIELRNQLVELYGDLDRLKQRLQDRQQLAEADACLRKCGHQYARHQALQEDIEENLAALAFKLVPDAPAIETKKRPEPSNN